MICKNPSTIGFVDFRDADGVDNKPRCYSGVLMKKTTVVVCAEELQDLRSPCRIVVVGQLYGNDGFDV